MLEGVDLADIHGQDRFNFQHAAISREDSKRFLDGAFRRDFERNGPSIYRICRTTLEGWLRYKNDPDPRVRARFAWEARSLQRRLRRGAVGHGKAPAAHQPGGQRKDPRTCAGRWAREFGLVSRVVSRACWARCCCGRRGAKNGAWRPGQTYEPQTIIERRNWTGPLPPGCPLPAGVATLTAQEQSLWLR